MSYINAVAINNNNYIIEPTLFATTTINPETNVLSATIRNFILVAGAYAHLKFGSEVPANASLNISETGNVPLFYNGTAISAGLLTPDNIYCVIYDGIQWNVMGDITGRDIMIGTTAEWQARSSFIAPAGTVLIFTDRGQVNNKNVPGIKISDGLAYVTSLPFVGDDVIAALRAEMNVHITDTIHHITNEERTYWNNKLNCENSVNNETLIFNRN